MESKPNVPTVYEVAELLDMARDLTGMTGHALMEAMAMSPNYLSKIKKKSAPLKLSTIREIRTALLYVVNEKLDPFFCPWPGLEKEWFEVVRAKRQFMLAAVDRVITEPIDHDALSLKAEGKKRRFLK